ncbi:MAG: 1-(5-phosphoribosyl)-5-[(5-phosphoribosylamino)methylideneamino]imidazole-4-carboxamide isomerase [Hungatella sp.]|nr:1-(5-phosphoribosyl)-5-[(5-phosphoribosylamino)methylideneamino]imidazole-4-carboxamide isomerase [Hungatella sp.]MCI9501439.1 1-(5-phosphoribosyl)-5-[(5-phosphoribosylamino)methylideneamino]imidazole-4-carboxamide isomerase [Hungatella sp.]
MQLYPAIDMKDGRCVRLTQGLFDNLKVYSEDPVDIAKMWVSQGATFLHLVDLDGALAGQSVNRSVIRGIVESVSVPVQVGGGIRSHEAVKSMLELGVRRVIIGTRAAKEPEFIRELTARFDPEQIVAGIDAKDGLVAVEGWEKVSSITALELCLRMKEYGVRHVVYTDISRDGMLSGPNVEATEKLTKDTGLDIIASGGVSCMDDLRKLRDRGIRGAIIGKALYEKKLDLKEAVGRFQ